MEKLVSVIVPIYNVENYVEQCVHSVICQTYKNLEIILVNDGSTDGSLEKIRDIKDNRIKIINQRNLGLSAARNAGVLASKGEYISFVDSDDFVSDEFIEIFVECMEKYDADIVCCESIDFLDGNDEKAYRLVNRETDMNQMNISSYSSDEAIIRMFYQKPSITGAVLKLYKRYLFNDVKFPEGRYYEDLATTYKFFQKSKLVLFISSKLYAYRIRASSIMGHGSEKKEKDCLWVSNQIIKDFLCADKEKLKAARCGVFRINRIVITYSDLDSKMFSKLWGNIRKSRKSVVMNGNANGRDRLMAVASYGGKRIFKSSSIIFNSIRTATKRMILYR